MLHNQAKYNSGTKINYNAEKFKIRHIELNFIDITRLYVKKSSRSIFIVVIRYI